MTLCIKKLQEGIKADCANPMYSGYKPLAYIINKDDIEGFVIAEDGSVSSIKLLAGTKAYRVEQNEDQPFKVTQNIVKGAHRNTWNNSIPMLIPAFGGYTFKSIIQPLTSGAKFVVILERERDAKNSWFEIFGIDKGLTAADGASCEAYNADTEGGWSVTMEETNAPRASRFFKATLASDRAANKKILDELLMAAGA